MSAEDSVIQTNHGDCDIIHSLASPLDTRTLQASPAWRPETWMKDLFSIIGDLAITEIRCVGTHNSGTYGINSDSDIAPDAPEFLLKPGCVSSCAGCLAHGTVLSWAICQNKTVLQQLEMGVRYLDMRIVTHTETHALMTTHSVYAAPMDEIIEDIVTFLNRPSSSHEFIIMDFQNVTCSPEYMEHDFYTDIEKLLRKCVFRDCGLQMSLRDLLRTRPERRIFLFLDPRFDEAAHPEVFPRNRYLKSSWKNAESPTLLLEELEKDVQGYLDKIKKGEGVSNIDPPSTIVVSQAIITADASVIVKSTLKHCCCCSCCCCYCCGLAPMERIALEFNTKAIGWFSHWNSQVDEENIAIPRGCGVHRNVLLLDFPEHGALQLKINDTEIIFDAVGWCVFLNILFAPIKNI